MWILHDRNFLIDRGGWSVSIGARIREFRKKMGFTQGDLAEGICNRSYISQMEKGGIIPSPEILESIAKRLQVSLDELYKESDRPAFTEIELKNALRLIANHVEEHDWDNARRWVHKLSRTTLTPRDQATYLWARGRLHHRDQRIKDAENDYLKSIELSRDVYEQTQEPIALVRALTSIGLLYSQFGEADKAMPHLREAYQLITTYPVSAVQRIAVHYVHGVMHARLGENKSAIEWLTRAKNLMYASRVLYHASDIHTVLGVCYRRIGQYDKAEECYRKALELVEALPDSSTESSIYNNLGILYRHQKRYEEALATFEKALSIHERNMDHHWLLNIYIEMAHVYKEMGQLDRAEEMCKQLLKQSEHPQQRAECQLVLAEIHLLRNRLEEAVKLANEAHCYFVENNRQDFLTVSYKLMVRIFATMANVEPKCL